MRFSPARRNVLTTLGALALLLGTASAAFAQAKQPPVPPAGGPPKADRDGDKIFDDLADRLAKLVPGDKLSVIVTLTAPATPDRIDELEQAVGQVAVSHRFGIIRAFAATMTKGQVEALARRPNVVKVEENSEVHALNDGAEAAFGVAKARVDAPGLDGDRDGSAATYSKDDLVAAVIDTGIYTGHLDLDEGKVIGFKDFVNGKTAPYDDNGHGTHVAGTIAGDGDARADRLYQGVAPGAALVGVKVLNGSGSGTMANVTAGIDWVVANKDLYGIEAINLSLGASGCADGTDATSQAVNNAQAAGLVVLAAAGNEGPGTCTIGSPGAAAGAITLGAMADTSADGFSQAWFSSRGPTADGRIKPDVSAPGVNITSAKANTTSSYVAYSGTSMATPFTVGVALLMLDANGALTPQQVKDKLAATAVDWGRGGNNKTAGSTGADIDYGAGRLDAYAALKAAGAALGAGPATPRHELREGTLSATGAVVDYKLDVSDLGFPIAATLIMPSLSAGAASSPDFDLYLYDPAGSVVARAETSDRQEEVGFKPPATGTYTLRVRSYSGSGAYFVDVSAGLGVDTTPPSITSVAPADGTTGVPATNTVDVVFSESMDIAAAQSAFSLVRSSDGAPVAGAFSWSGTTMKFDPSPDLAYETQYTAKVSTTAKDTAGNTLTADKSWTFTTAGAPVSITVFPASTVIQSGSLRSGDATRLKADDDSFYQVNSTTSSTYTSSWYGKFSGVSNALKSLKATYRGKNSRTCTQTLSVWRWTTSSWVQLNSSSVGATEIEIANVGPTGTLADYVSGSSGDGEVRIRLRCQTTAGSFNASGDLLKIEFTK